MRLLRWYLPIAGLVLTALVGGCSSDGSPQGTVPLTVVVGLNGGPSVNGHQAMTGAPEPGEQVSVTNAAGHVVKATTDSAGLAIMHLKPGRYTVSSVQCGTGSSGGTVVLSSNRTPVLYRIECGIH